MSSYTGTPSPKDKPDGTSDNEIMPRPALTFGVELEFGIACLPQGYIDPNPEDSRQVYGILETGPPEFPLAEIPCLGLHEPICIDDDIDEWEPIQQHIANTLKQRLRCCSDVDANATPYDLASSWIVKNDSSIKFPPLNYKFRDIEVASPPFNFCKEALNEVTLVCETLPSQYRLISNTSCSTHVHVGNGIRGFTVPHLRNLMAILWTFESQLDTLHPQHRVGPTRYNGSLRAHSYLGLQLQARGMNARDGLRRIFDTQEINEIVHMLSLPSTPSKMLCNNMGYSISNLMEKGTSDSYENFVEAEKTKKTVEFRHHEGTFDAEAVTQWIRLCVRLVEFAGEVRPDELRSWLEEHIDTDYNVIQILEATKQPLAACFYRKKLAERREHGPDTSRRIVPNYHVDHLEDSMVDDYIRELGDWCQERERRWFE
ncbi:putative amidoligase enzyme-domain-containing protein [Cadophora sp. MPI-SDFR-AT-0126]|nr:putative amidoligase enzyme-domain-containing protein [Leotiomycetes sp. MPI-SDFR-AT-0126]